MPYDLKQNLSVDAVGCTSVVFLATMQSDILAIYMVVSSADIAYWQLEGWFQFCLFWVSWCSSSCKKEKKMSERE